MRKVIPFKKDLEFKTNISEITSISLEHKINIKNDDIISGEFYINGEYKINDTSKDKEEFSFDIPFDIALSNSIDIDNMVLDIDNFYYDIVNGKLKVGIDVLIDAEDKEIPQDEMVRNDEDTLKEESIITKEEINTEIEIPKIDVLSLENDNQNIDNIFDMNNQKETYSPYHVYIVKEEDTIDTITSKYNVTKEDIAIYNDIDNIKVKDKIVIPAIFNE